MGRCRILKFAKWTVVALFVLSVALWARSIIRYGTMVTSGKYPLTGLSLLVGVNGFVPWIGQSATNRKWVMPSIENDEDGFGAFVRIPHWFAVLVSATAALILLIIDRRRIQPGHCQRCGYDLRSTVSDRCSECGTLIASGAAR